MARQLGNEHQAQPTLATALGDPGDLLEEERHLRDSLVGQEFVGLLDDHEDRRRRRAALLMPAIRLILSVLDAAEHVGDHQVVDRGGIRIGEVENADTTPFEQRVVVQPLGRVEDLEPPQPVEMAKQGAP